MGLTEAYEYYWIERAAQQTKDFPLVSSFYQVPLIEIAYFLLIFKIIPAHVEHRKPYRLTNVIRLYNIVQAYLNGYIAYTTYTLVRSGELTLYCHPGTNETVASLVWLGMMLKVLDLLDTILFALKKKHNQITFLHVYHHSVTLVLWWLATRYEPTGMTCITSSINGFVHVVMYTYYFASTFRVMGTLVVRIKPFVTILQLVQFAILLIHMAQGLMPSCGYSTYIAAFILSHVIVNVFLFLNFFQRSYMKKDNKSE